MCFALCIHLILFAFIYYPFRSQGLHGNSSFIVLQESTPHPHNLIILNSYKWLGSHFSLQYHPWIKHLGQENIENDHQRKKLLIVKQTVLVSALGNAQRTVWRICILMLGCEGLSELLLNGVSVTFQCCTSAHKRRVEDENKQVKKRKYQTTTSANKVYMLICSWFLVNSSFAHDSL